MIIDILAGLGFNQDESRTYLALLETPGSTAGSLAKRLGVPRPSIYGWLKKLTDEGLVTQSLKGGVKLFIAANPVTIKKMLDQKASTFAEHSANFDVILPLLQNQRPLDALTPRFEFFEGAEGVKNVLQDMLLYSGIETRSYWPMRSMVEVLGADFFQNHNLSRIKNRSSVMAIWPKEQIINLKDHPYLGAGKDYLREIRIAPPHINFSMGYWIYKNKVAFLSSKRESFGFIIESAELSEMLTSQHQMIWDASAQLPMNAKDLQPFLQKLKQEERKSF
jgi:sugar-specific transcriptional regulator TrmB